MGKIIGIDLGTTNSCVAVMEGGTGYGDRVRVRLISETAAMARCENPNLETAFPGFVNEGNFQITP